MRPKPASPVLLILCLTILAVAWPAPARAQHRRVRGSAVFFSGGYYSPFFWPYYGGWYPYPVFSPYYYPPMAYRYGYEADIRLQVKPRQAQVYVDGYYAGIVDDFDGVFQRLHVRPGGHEITLYLNGYRTIRQNVLVSPTGTYKMRYEMEPLPAGEKPEPVPPPSAASAEGGAPEYRGRPQGPPPGPYGPGPGRMPPPGGRTMPPEAGGEATRFGTLALRVQPADADVSIDGEQWRGPEGQDRLTVQLAAGPHRIEIRKPGYEPYSTEVQIRRGETTPLNVSLPRS